MNATAAPDASNKPPLTKVGALRQVIEAGAAGTQEELREELLKLGHDLNQSTISRTLRKLGAIKRTDENGRTTYELPDESTLPPPVQSSLNDLIHNISENGSIIVLTTSAGSASLIARHLDHYRPGGLIGTIAGEDTIFVAPASAAAIPETLRAITEMMQS